VPIRRILDQEPIPIARGQCPVDLGCEFHHRLLSSTREVRSNRVAPAVASLEGGDIATAEERSPR
jgi:hypothetical protein